MLLNFCPACGSRLNNLFKFCPSCGLNISSLGEKTSLSEINEIPETESVWQKLRFSTRDFESFVEFGTGPDPFDDDWNSENLEEMYTSLYPNEITHLRNRLILSKSEFETLNQISTSERGVLKLEHGQFTASHFYAGELKDGKMSGYGVILIPVDYENTGISKYAVEFFGHFQNNELNGEGGEINYRHQVPIYIGEWKNGIKHGQGTSFQSNKEKYIGAFKDGNRDGIGAYYHENGNKSSEGWWRENLMEGPGTDYYYSTGKILYQGDFENSLRDGHGKYFYENGNVYEGEFSNNLCHGKGDLIQSDGGVYSGDWFEDKIQGVGKFIFPDGSVYEGDWVENQRTGKGQITQRNGLFYSGEWLNDRKHGFGKMTIQGTSFSCNWENDIPVSEATCTDINGNVTKGRFTIQKEGGELNLNFVPNDPAIIKQPNTSPIPPKDGAGIR